MEEHYEEVIWKDPKISWMKKIKGTRILKCLRCGSTSSLIKILHFYHGHKNCLPKYTMKVECSWCGLDMGTKPCNEGQQNKISHGICGVCKIKMEREI